MQLADVQNDTLYKNISLFENLLLKNLVFKTSCSISLNFKISCSTSLNFKISCSTYPLELSEYKLETIYFAKAGTNTKIS